MTDDNDAGKAEGKPPRKGGLSERALWSEQRARGFFAASDYVKKTVRKAGSSHGFAESRLLTQWRETVGEELAALCEPVRVSYAAKAFGATLIVWCDGARAPEVEMLKPRLLERVNQKYGYNAITRVHISQSEKPPQRRRTPGAPRLRSLTTAEERQVEELISDIGDPGLKEALRRLGRNVKSRVPAPADGPATPRSDMKSNQDSASEGPSAPPTRSHS